MPKHAETFLVALLPSHTETYSAEILQLLKLLPRNLPIITNVQNLYNKPSKYVYSESVTDTWPSAAEMDGVGNGSVGSF